MRCAMRGWPARYSRAQLGELVVVRAPRAATQAAQVLGLVRSALKRVGPGAELPPDPKRMARACGVTAAQLAAVVRGTGA